MTAEWYAPWPNQSETPNPRHQAIIDWANVICAELVAQGYNLTLRQLYYQFVARGLIENTQQSYNNIGSVVNDARLAGLLDWDYLEDRTRNLAGFNHAHSVEEFVIAQRTRYHVDHWAEQGNRVEVWVEKEALADVVSRIALRWDLDYFACRGYVSQSEMYSASQRHLNYERQGQPVTILHLGDHDPSGIDMTRDIGKRLWTFGTHTEVIRVALTMDQIDQYNPPPNPAKVSDSRAKDYIQKYGDESWELDALPPQVLDGLLTPLIQGLLTDSDAFIERNDQQKMERELLELAGTHWAEVRALLESKQ